MLLSMILATLLLAFLGPAHAQVPSDAAASPCAATCVNNVFSNGGGIGCTQGDNLCVCSNLDAFRDGIRDCVIQACVGPLGESPEQVDYAQQQGASVCAAAGVPASSVTTTSLFSTPSSQPTESQATAASLTTSTTSEVQSMTASPTTSEETQSTTDSTFTPWTTISLSSPSPASTTESISGQLSSFSMSALTVSSTMSITFSTALSSTATSLTAASSTAAISATSSESGAPTSGSTFESANEPEGSSESSTGERLSYPVKVGIIVACSVGAALIITFALVLMVLRRRKLKKSKGKLSISDPLPGSGRQYAAEPKNVESSFPTFYTPTRPSPMSSNSNGGRASYSSERDIEARRYEDMMPRAQPRMMI